MSTVITLVGSVMVFVGVNVAVHVVPPSLLLTVDSVPFATVRSALVNPVTGPLKVKVTKDVSAMLKALSETTMVTVGDVGRAKAIVLNREAKLKKSNNKT